MEKRIIMVEFGKAVLIAKAFGISKAMVSRSLRGHIHNEMAQKIRHVALTQYGGVEMQQVNPAKAVK